MCVKVDRNWLRGFFAEYRITSRRPNRKFKVPRWVLAERLKIFWIVVATLRKLIMLHFGYDPKARNVDQSPFHQNEAGSAECNTLALVGAPTVPLIENHAATRERWSLNSVTDSSIERVSQVLPGFEIMFKAEGKAKEAKLRAYVVAQGLPFKISVVTGPSGSYREHDILEFLDKWLEPWGEGREWEFFILDAYAPGLTDNVQRLCWIRGYICITHGGGASMVAQTNDTDLHLWVRKRFIELQTALVIRKARSKGGGLVDLTPEENIDLMIQVMSDPAIHLQAAKGYKYTGTTVALDGSEDSMICREAKDFWTELDMRTHINAAVAEVEAKHAAGLLPWEYKVVQSLITPYPRRGHMDVVKVGQEDEATLDPDANPWEDEDEDAPDDEEEDAQEDEDADGGDDVMEGEIPDWDPADWVEGDAAFEKHGERDADAARHGDGDAPLPIVSLTSEQSECVVEHSSRLRNLQQAQDLCKEVGGTLGTSLRDTVGRVIRSESKRINAQLHCDPRVYQAMRQSLEAEEAAHRRERFEFQAHMQQQREKDRVHKVLTQTETKLKTTQKKLRDAEALVAANEQVKAYSLEALGKGKKKGGPQQCHKARLQVLERVRKAAEMSPEQIGQWEYFKTNYDQKMAEVHGEDWAVLFAQHMQHVLNEMLEGRTNALSVFMDNETRRVLAETPVLFVPGCGGKTK